MHVSHTNIALHRDYTEFMDSVLSDVHRYTLHTPSINVIDLLDLITSTYLVISLVSKNVLKQVNSNDNSA